LKTKPRNGFRCGAFLPRSRWCEFRCEFLPPLAAHDPLRRVQHDLPHGFAPLFPLIMPMFLRHHYKGTIGGTGLKLHPSSLCNLYHWVLGEDAMWRLQNYVGWIRSKLPDPAWAYADDDGLVQ